MKNIELKIDGSLSGKTIKYILFEYLHLSQRLVSKMKRTGAIKLNKEQRTVRAVANSGDVLTLEIVEEASENIVPKPLPLDIVYEDEDILAVNKPRNMPTHPSPGHYEDTLANAVMYYYRDKGFVFRAVSRLDRDTTGIVLIAKNSIAAKRLSEQIKHNEIKKTYYAVCVGEFEHESASVDAAIKRDEESAVKRVVSENGKYAVTEYRALMHKNGFSLVELKPITGRTHQIRVHMSYIGHPLFGDFLYGEEIENESMRLHCAFLEFRHPSTNEVCVIKAPLPTDFYPMV